MAFLMCVVILLLLASFPIAVMCYCYKNKKIKLTFDLQQSQRREDNVQRAYEIVLSGHTSTSEVTYTTVGGSMQPQNETAMETPLVVYDTVQGTNTQSSYSTTPNSEPTSHQEFQRESTCNDPHRVYHILTNENEPTNGGSVVNSKGPIKSSVYHVVAKKDLPNSKAALYNALDHTKRKGREKPGKQDEIEDYNTLQHPKNLRLAHSASDSRVLLTHAPPIVVYETIDKPEAQKATALPGQPVYSTLEAPKYSLVNKKSKSTSAVEGLPKTAAGGPETVNKNTTEAIDTNTAGGWDGNGNSDTASATVPEETEVSQGACGGSGSQTEVNTESKQSMVSAVKCSTKKLPNYDVVTKQDLMTSLGDTTRAVYSTLDHTKPRTPKTVRESEDMYNSLQHDKNTRLAHNVSDSRVLLMSVHPTVVYETIDTPREVKATALSGQAVYSTLGKTKCNIADKKSKSTSGIRNEAANGLNVSSATGSSRAGMETNSPSTVEGTACSTQVQERTTQGQPPRLPDRPPKSIVH